MSKSIQKHLKTCTSSNYVFKSDARAFNAVSRPNQVLSAHLSRDLCRMSREECRLVRKTSQTMDKFVRQRRIDMMKSACATETLKTEVEMVKSAKLGVRDSSSHPEKLTEYRGAEKSLRSSKKTAPLLRTMRNVRFVHKTRNASPSRASGSHAPSEESPEKTGVSKSTTDMVTTKLIPLNSTLEDLKQAIRNGTAFNDFASYQRYNHLLAVAKKRESLSRASTTLPPLAADVRRVESVEGPEPVMGARACTFPSIQLRWGDEQAFCDDEPEKEHSRPQHFAQPNAAQEVLASKSPRQIPNSLWRNTRRRQVDFSSLLEPSSYTIVAKQLKESIQKLAPVENDELCMYLY